jgi:hypothetical protein
MNTNYSYKQILAEWFLVPIANWLLANFVLHSQCSTTWKNRKVSEDITTFQTPFCICYINMNNVSGVFEYYLSEPAFEILASVRFERSHYFQWACHTCILNINMLFTWSWDISVSIVSDYEPDDQAIGIRSQAGAKDFSSSLCVQTGSEAHLVSCKIGTMGPFPRAKCDQGVTLTTHPHLVPRSRMSRSYTPLPHKCHHGV